MNATEVKTTYRRAVVTEYQTFLRNFCLLKKMWVLTLAEERRILASHSTTFYVLTLLLGCRHVSVLLLGYLQVIRYIRRTNSTV